jgi:hypothetical protein
MKKFKLLFLFLIAIVSVKAQDITKEEIKKSLEDGIVSFVQSVKSTKGIQLDSYENFKLSLIGSNNLKSIPTEGNDLLSITYQLIKENASEAVIVSSGYTIFGKATKFVLETETKNSNPSKTLQNGSIALFGGDETSLKGYDANNAGRSEAGCGTHQNCAHWYNFGCHINNAAVWLCNHVHLLEAIVLVLEGLHLLGIF